MTDDDPDLAGMVWQDRQDRSRAWADASLPYGHPDRADSAVNRADEDAQMTDISDAARARRYVERHRPRVNQEMAKVLAQTFIAGMRSERQARQEKRREQA